MPFADIALTSGQYTFFACCLVFGQFKCQTHLGEHLALSRGSTFPRQPLYGKHTFRFVITKTWEEILTKIKTLSYHKFKKEYKQS